jgi:hypothetical protein
MSLTQLNHYQSTAAHTPPTTPLMHGGTAMAKGVRPAMGGQPEGANFGGTGLFEGVEAVNYGFLWFDFFQLRCWSCCPRGPCNLRTREATCARKHLHTAPTREAAMHVRARVAQSGCGVTSNNCIASLLLIVSARVLVNGGSS